MDSLFEQNIFCPYCGESISVLIDPQEVGQQYIEDCQVCCRPIVFQIFEDETGDIQVVAESENDA
jgi:hypothetical protein